MAHEFISMIHSRDYELELERKKFHANVTYVLMTEM